jgi:oxaloacetate decarboxylase beta subunit
MVDNNKKKIILLIVAGIIISFFLIAVISKLPLIDFSIKEASATAIIGGADGPTTIYISNSNNWKYILFYTLLLFAIDLLVLIILKIIEYKRKKNINLKYLVLFIIIFNIPIVLLLLPSTLIHLMIVNSIVILIYLSRKIFKKDKK